MYSPNFGDIIPAAKLKGKNRVSESAKSRETTYRSIDSILVQHPVYTSLGIHEAERISSTRLGLSSHRLKIEIGRWSRIPQNERLCTCGGIQTEEHILIHSPETEALRRRYHSCDIPTLVSYCHKALLAIQYNTFPNIGEPSRGMRKYKIVNLLQVFHYSSPRTLNHFVMP